MGGSLYDILGVTADADPEAIKRAYREKAKRCHPDTVPEQDPQSFRDLQEAYETLGDAERRRRYDARRKAGPGAPPSGSEGPRPGPASTVRRPTDPGLWFSLLSETLGGGAPWGGGPGGCWELILSPAEVRQGGRVTLVLPLEVTCPRCGGRGWAAVAACRACRGRGARVEERALVVDLPPGLASGNRLVIPGRRHGFPARDLVLTIRVDAWGV